MEPVPVELGKSYFSMLLNVKMKMCLLKLFCILPVGRTRLLGSWAPWGMEKDTWLNEIYVWMATNQTYLAMWPCITVSYAPFLPLLQKLSHPCFLLDFLEVGQSQIFRTGCFLGTRTWKIRWRHRDSIPALSARPLDFRLMSGLADQSQSQDCSLFPVCGLCRAHTPQALSRTCQPTLPLTLSALHRPLL